MCVFVFVSVSVSVSVCLYVCKGLDYGDKIYHLPFIPLLALVFNHQSKVFLTQLFCLGVQQRLFG